MDDYDDILSELRGSDDDDDNPLGSFSSDSDNDDLFAALGGDDDSLFGEFADPSDLGYDGADLSALDAAVGSPPVPPMADEPADSADTLSALRSEPEFDSDQTIPSEEGLTGQFSDEPSWVAQLDSIDIDGEPKKPAAAKPKASAKAKKGRSIAVPKNFLGLTPQQRMILSIALFLDISVLGCLILIAFDVIGF